MSGIPTSPVRVVQVTAPHFCAGIVIEGDRCVRAAPILKWAVGKSADDLREQFRGKGWKAVLAASPSQEPK